LFTSKMKMTHVGWNMMTLGIRLRESERRCSLALWVFCFVFFFGSAGIWTQGFELTKLGPHHQSILLWLFWRRGLENYCLGWPWTMMLSMSTSQVDRITGLHHQCLPLFCVFSFYSVAATYSSTLSNKLDF
jgi:hypothetical protein